MKHIYKLCGLLIITLFTFTKSVTASHIYGADLYYTHVSNNTYKITLTLYGDCAGGAFPNLSTSVPLIRILNGNSFIRQLNLAEQSQLRKEVSPVCPDVVDSTSCRIPGSTLPGVTMFVYTANTDLPPSANWRIVFEGELSNNLAGRTNAITNIDIDPVNGSVMTLITTLDNSSGPNNSPQFTTVPTPFYCINVPQQYNLGSVDADGDSLSFSLTDALLPGQVRAVYISPYTGANPLQVAAGSFSFNKNNGQTNFTPNALQQSVIVNKVEEYRNGKLVGSTMREMTYVVLNNCNNNPPDGKIDTNKTPVNNIIQGGIIIDDYDITTCTTTDTLRLSLPVTDIDSDNVNITINNAPQNADVNITGNGGPTPFIKINWGIAGTAPGSYNIYATLEDEACPLASKSSIVYTVNVVKPNAVDRRIIKPTNCKHQEYTELTFTDGLLPRNVIITDDKGKTLHELTDTTGVFADSFKLGTYFVTVSSAALPCTTDYSFTVEDMGVYPDTPKVRDINACLGSTPVNIIPDTVAGSKVNWYDNENNLLPGVPSYQTDVASKTRYYVSQTVKVCESEKYPFDVVVHDPPEIEITNQPGRVCIGEGMFLEAKGGVKYEWRPEHRVEEYDGKPYTYLTEPTMYVVTGYSQYNCEANDTVVYNDIEQCCNFAYPSAFTPNNDGVNDGWKPLLYGYVQQYLLSVYDRWGKRIFITSDPYENWDGTLNGKTCDVGTYHFTLKARCVTGKNEVNSGSFILIR